MGAREGGLDKKFDDEDMLFASVANGGGDGDGGGDAGASSHQGNSFRPALRRIKGHPGWEEPLSPGIQTPKTIL